MLEVFSGGFETLCAWLLVLPFHVPSANVYESRPEESALPHSSPLLQTVNVLGLNTCTDKLWPCSCVVCHYGLLCQGRACKGDLVIQVSRRSRVVMMKEQPTLSDETGCLVYPVECHGHKKGDSRKVETRNERASNDSEPSLERAIIGSNIDNPK